MNSHKKKFQKPNILRRKPVLNKSSFVQKTKSENYEYQDMKTLLASSFVLEPKSKESKEQNDKSFKPFDSNKKSVQKVDNHLTHVLCNIQLEEENEIAKNNMMCVDSTIKKFNNELNQNQIINVDPFLSEPLSQDIPVFECFTSQNKIENEVKQKWCLELGQDTQKIIIEQGDNVELAALYTEQKPPHLDAIPHTEDSSLQNQQSNVLENTIFTPISNIQIQSIGQLITISATFKCEVPDCNKEFISKQKLNKHMSIHNKDSNTKLQRPVTVECPAKKVHGGVNDVCGRIFHVREDLMKHLNVDHTTDDAIYSCTECNRRFFWGSGLRAHARSHMMRVEIPCPWPGCPRVFRQPCRLREHSRAHTGDRPYPCLYPNCGWSFRTASKLMRHARRHTGDRRHTCSACGRAFLRREHLRDHATRHSEPGKRATHACPHADCQQSFTNMSSLYMHMKKVHKKEEIQQPVLKENEKQEQPVSKKVQNMFVVNLLEPPASTEVESTEVESTELESTELESTELESTEVESTAIEVETSEEVFQEETEDEEGHSARTHCTWPLTSRTLQYQHNAYVLGDDVQVEQSEGSESNIRSDLFLHGNVLHNEDSEQMARCPRESEGEGEGDVDGAGRGGALSLDADLLLDAPSVHLDQEELYTDAVESSFRVFLLSGEELT